MNLYRSMAFAALLVGASAGTALPALAADPGRNARIPFADMGGIADWRADGDRGIYVQATGGQWYYAAFMGRCLGLQFRDRVGFMTEPGGDLDKFSAVVVGGQPCEFTSFGPSSPPPR